MNQHQQTGSTISHVLKLGQIGLITSLVLLGTGCQLFKKDPLKPAALVKIEQPSMQLVSVWSESIGHTNKYDLLRFQLDRAGDIVVAADQTGEVKAWNKAGKQLWKTKLKVHLSAGVVVANDTVVVSGIDGRVSALDLESGAVRWQKALPSTVLAPALVAQNRVVVLTNDGTVSALDLSTGKTVWNFDVTMPMMSVRGTASPILVDNNTVIISGAAGKIFALDLVTGVPQWDARVANTQGRTDFERLIDIDGEPIQVGRMLYIVSYQGQLVAYHLDSQRVLWVKDSSSLHQPASDRGQVYIAHANGDVVAFDASSGQLLWTQSALKNRQLSNPVILGGQIVVGDAQGYLHLLDQTDGHLIGRAQTKGQIRQLRVVDSQLFVQTAAGALSIWQPK